MALILKDRVAETSTTTGTGTLTLAGAQAGFLPFSEIGNGNSTFYAIIDNTAWEIGIGTYTLSGTLLSRDTVLSSSNAGALVNFGAGAKNVFLTYPAEFAVVRNMANVFTAGQSGALVPLTSSATITPDFAEGNFFSLTLDTTATLANGSNAVEGQSGTIFVTQDATGSRILSYGSNYKFVGGIVPVLSTTANAVDRLDYLILSPTHIQLTLSKDWK